jgi:putative ABC transport system permease protein
MTPLNTKLRRELVQLRGPVLAASLVIATGIVAFLSMRGAYLSLEAGRASYFERARFADVVASTARTPDTLITRALAIPGVEAVEPRVTATVSLHMPGLQESARAALVSTHIGGLNRLTVRQGDAPGRPLEVMVSDAFAAAHALQVGDPLTATVEGRRVTLRVVGIGGAPDFLYVVPPGGLWPDDTRFGVLWMEHDSATALLGARGSFDELLVRLEGAGERRDLVERDVVTRLDALLADHGGHGARRRDEQVAWRFISEELRQLDTQTYAVPMIFLGIAALLLNMVLVRLVETQREIIALLKAVGYPSAAIAWHYVKLALAIVLPGIVMGVAGGFVAGRALIDVYRRYFAFDQLDFQLPVSLVAAAVLMSLVSGVAGAFGAARRAASLQPAAAMQPPTPPGYRRGLAEQAGVLSLLSPRGRMVVRQLGRRPGRTFLTVVGVALSVAIVVVASVLTDAIDYAVDLYFGQACREDVEVTLFVPQPRSAVLREIMATPGVLHAEATRMVAIRAHGPAGEWEGGLEARDVDGTLRIALDDRGHRLPPLPDDGVVLTEELANRLGVRPGDVVTVQRLDGDRREARTFVAGLTRDMLGLHCVSSLPTAARLFGDGDLVTGALLQVDPLAMAAVNAALQEHSNVAGVGLRVATRAAFDRMMTEAMMVTRSILALLASLLAVGIVYNNARIALAERSRELATLRVLGMTRGEVSVLFVGEQMLLLVLALPLGWGIGRLLAGVLMASLTMSDIYRLPLVTVPSTYLFATAVVLLAGVFTSLLMRRRLDRLDLVAVLKARE